MTDPISYASASPRHALPFLFAGQAQKEFFVNEALSRIDGLLHPVVEGELSTPPLTATDGQSFLIGASPTGSWADHADKIACRQSGNWLFATPTAGMRVFDKATGQVATYDAGWNRALPVALPTGGTTVDAQARTAIEQLIDALKAAGILP